MSLYEAISKNIFKLTKPHWDSTTFISLVPVQDGVGTRVKLCSSQGLKFLHIYDLEEDNDWIEYRREQDTNTVRQEGI